MSTYDDAGRQIFWSWDQATGSAGVVPGPSSVFHAFSVEVSRRRALSLCGREMLAYSVPANIEDLRFDSVRVPICRPCSDAAGTTAAFRLAKARFARKGS